MATTTTSANAARSRQDERKELRKELLFVQHLLDRANVELRSRKRELRHLDEMLDALPAGRIAAAAKAESTPVTNGPQSRTGRRVLLAPHPSPLAETPMRTGLTLPVPSQSCRSKWTSPTSSQCGPGARHSFSAAELQSSRAEAWAERMAARAGTTATSQETETEAGEAAEVEEEWG
jgi:hypothetical protein